MLFLIGATDYTALGLGLMGGGGLAGLATVWVNSRQSKSTARLEENKSAIDQFDKLSGRLESENALLVSTLDRERADHVKQLELKDAEIAALKAQLGRKR